MNDEPITDAELAEWKALAEAATPGPWKRCPCGGCSSVFTADGEAYVHIEPSTSVDPYTIKPKEDAAFIAASRAALPRLLFEVEQLRAENQRWRNRMDASENERQAMQKALTDTTRQHAEWQARAKAAEANVKPRRAVVLCLQLKLLLAEVMLASESLPAVAEAQLIKAIEATNELGAWLTAQPDQIGPQLDPPV